MMCCARVGCSGSECSLEHSYLKPLSLKVSLCRLCKKVHLKIETETHDDPFYLELRYSTCDDQNRTHFLYIKMNYVFNTMG